MLLGDQHTLAFLKEIFDHLWASHNHTKSSSSRYDCCFMDRIRSGQWRATTACPARGTLVSFLHPSLPWSRSDPIITLSLASSNSFMKTTRLPFLAARRAASFTKLARSAPENQGYLLLWYGPPHPALGELCAYEP